MGREIPWRLIRFWSLAPGHATQPGLLWAGTIPGGLFWSEDSGDTWHLVEALWHMPERLKWAGGGADAPGIHSICVDPRDGNRVVVAVSSGGVWHTPDLGMTWSAHTDGHAGGLRAPRTGVRPGIPGSAPHGAVPRRAGHLVDPASQRHLPQHGRRHELDRDRGREALGLRLPGGGASQGSQHGLVRAGHQGRAPHPRRGPGGGEPHPGRRDAASRPCAGACPNPGPTTWSTATPWTSTPRASAWPSAPPPAPCGSARTAATTG
jgi:hypothetical protein